MVVAAQAALKLCSRVIALVSSPSSSRQGVDGFADAGINPAAVIRRRRAQNVAADPGRVPGVAYADAQAVKSLLLPRAGMMSRRPLLWPPWPRPA